MCNCSPVYCEVDNVTYPSCGFSCEEDNTGWSSSNETPLPSEDDIPFDILFKLI